MLRWSNLRTDVRQLAGAKYITATLVCRRALVIGVDYPFAIKSTSGWPITTFSARPIVARGGFSNVPIANSAFHQERSVTKRLESLRSLKYESLVVRVWPKSPLRSHQRSSICISLSTWRFLCGWHRAVLRHFHETMAKTFACLTLWFSWFWGGSQVVCDRSILVLSITTK